MSQITDFSFEDVMGAAVKLYGHDENMEACADLNELRENIGEESLDGIVAELDNQ